MDLHVTRGHYVRAPFQCNLQDCSLKGAEVGAFQDIQFVDLHETIFYLFHQSTFTLHVWAHTYTA